MYSKCVWILIVSNFDGIGGRKKSVKWIKKLNYIF